MAYKDPYPAFAENAPPWLCITSANFACSPTGQNYHCETPEHAAIRLAARAESHAMAVAREEAKRAARARASAESKANNKKLRAEMSEQLKAERALGDATMPRRRGAHTEAEKHLISVKMKRVWELRRFYAKCEKIS